MLDIFTQATKDALALLGESAFLRGTVSCQVNIERGVQLAGLDTEFETARETRNAVMTRDVVTIDASLDPKVGNTLRVGAVVEGAIPVGQNYRLDVLLEDGGPFRRFVLLKTA